MKDFNLEHWEDLERSYRDQFTPRDQLIRRLISERELIYQAMSINESRYRSGALEFIKLLPVFERTYFFPQLMSIASFVHGYTEEYRDLIKSLPHDWVMAHIEPQIEEILKNGDYEEYRCLLEICRLVDHALMEKLARKAASNSDPDIKEAGQDYLDL